jgi:hypothetical protein
MSTEHKPVVRCAIYTRKSSEEGLEQSFNSLDAHGVSFVSITQQFNTTSSMGRLTLNVLLSFCSVRAGSHGRKNSGQDHRLEAQRHVDGRLAPARL